MPRIRTIKPEFWDSPGTARASLRARLFFIAMWNWADDYGIGTANPKQLIGFAFPNDDDVTVTDYPRLVAEVSDCFEVIFYHVDGRPFYAIPSWEKHQRTEKRAKRRNPLPSEGIQTVTDSPRHSADVPSLEQGNRGTGEQGNSDYVGATTSPPPAPAVIDAANDNMTATRQGNSSQIILGEWLRDQPSRPPSDVIGQLGKRIAQLVRDGIDRDLIRNALDQWSSRGLHPSVLPSIVHELQTKPGRANKPSTTDQRVTDAFALAQQLAVKENS